MTELDFINIKNLLKFREIVETGPTLYKEGSMSLEQLQAKSSKELKKMEEDYIWDVIKKIKVLTNFIFDTYAEKDNNIIVISAAYYSDEERCTVSIDDPLNEVDFKDSEYNSLFYPVNPDCVDKTFETKVDQLEDLLHQIGIPYAEDYFMDKNEPIDEYWYGYIGIMKDYKVVSFVVRHDNVLSTNDRIEHYPNHIIRDLSYLYT